MIGTIKEIDSIEELKHLNTSLIQKNSNYK